MRRLWCLLWLLWCPLAAAGTADIGVTGDDYLWMATFQQQAEEVSAYLLTIEPYKSHAGAFRFIVVPTQRDLYCTRSVSMSRLITCNATIVRDVFTQAGYPPLEGYMVLVNTAGYGGSGGIQAVSYNGSQRRQVMAHEFQHHFAGLTDEYNLSLTAGPLTNTFYAQCWAGLTAPVGQGTWVKGCRYPNYWRQRAVTASGTLVDSLMKALTYPLLNARSRALAEQRIQWHLQD